MTRGAARLLVDMGFAPVLELALPNGRRVDITAVSQKGDITMVEVKSCRADFDIDKKWPEYKDYCDRFFFAVPEDFPSAMIPASEGLILADGFGGAVIRDAPRRPLAGGRRKTALIRLARHAALRSLSADVAQVVRSP